MLDEWRTYAHDAGLDIDIYEYSIAKRAFLYGYIEGNIEGQKE